MSETSKSRCRGRARGRARLATVDEATPPGSISRGALRQPVFSPRIPGGGAVVSLPSTGSSGNAGVRRSPIGCEGTTVGSDAGLVPSMARMSLGGGGDDMGATAETPPRRQTLGAEEPRPYIFGGYSRENRREMLLYETVDTRPVAARRAAAGDATSVLSTVSSYTAQAPPSRPLQLFANAFAVERDGGGQRLQLFQYHVDFKPVQDNKKERLGLVEANWNAIVERVELEPRFIFDGAVLFSPDKIRGGRREICVMATTRSGEEVTITIRYTSTLDTLSPTSKQVYNRLFRDSQSKCGLVQIGRHYFNPNLSLDVPKYKIQIWPGFTSCIDQRDDGLVLCLDPISKVMKPISVWQQMLSWVEEMGPQKAQEKAVKEIVGETVLCKHNNKTYRVDGISFDKSPDSEFEKADGSKLSYREYFENQYHIQLDPRECLLEHRLKPKEKRTQQVRGILGDSILLPTSLCFLTGLGNMRQDAVVMRDVASQTRYGPSQRMEIVQKQVRNLQQQPEARSELNKIGLRFAESPLPIRNGRQLPPTKIFLGDRPVAYRQDQADWSRNLTDGRWNHASPLRDWLVLTPTRCSSEATRFVNELISVGRRVGMEVSQPRFFPLDRVGGAEYVAGIREECDAKCQLILSVLPDDRKDRYDAIKRLVCCDRALPSQNVLARTIGKEKILRSVATKVLMQMNCKLRGSLWNADIPIKRPGVLMVVGVDTFQDAKLSEGRSKKVSGAFVASYDHQATQWFSRHIRQSPEESLESSLRRAMRLALENYRKHNKVLPERVVLYRDGVGDGQLRHVHQNEVSEYIKAFEDMERGYMPKLTVIVVTKRVPARFFLGVGDPKRENMRFHNPPPGSVVDTTITKHKSEMHDFYIVSQATNQGTVSPTHYNVIHDSSGWSLDRQQALAYKLCHLYYNWAGAIRVPAPCQYAHKLAFMVNQNLLRAPSDGQQDVLWYL